ncbi:MAG: dpgD 6 [Subtercola sp.]|nr:dpgD 6 [Subtercola sp.]
MAEEQPGILDRKTAGVLTITFDRPEAGNALRAIDRDAVIELLGQAHNDSGVRAVVIRANGRHFCTGADVAGLGRRDETRAAAGDISRRIMGGAQQLIAAILDCDKPIISVVHGAAAGMGAHVAYASDFVIASHDASFIEAFVLRGLTVDAGGAYLLPRLIGLQKAKELAMLGDKLSADDAFALGLVNRVVAAPELDDAVEAFANRLAAAPTTAIALTKRLFNASLDADRRASFQLEGLVQEIQSHSLDSTEGVRSFVERRAAEFQGR